MLMATQSPSHLLVGRVQLPGHQGEYLHSLDHRHVLLPCAMSPHGGFLGKSCGKKMLDAHQPASAACCSSVFNITICVDSGMCAIVAVLPVLVVVMLST